MKTISIVVGGTSLLASFLLSVSVIVFCVAFLHDFSAGLFKRHRSAGKAA